MNKKIIYIIAVVLAPLIILPLVMFFSDFKADSFIQATTASPQPKQTNAFIEYKLVTPEKPAKVVNGFDWSLPKGTAISSNSGLIDEYENGLKFVQNSFLIIRWDDANPKQGQFDFSRFETDLSSSSPKKALIRLEVNSFCEAPKWAQKILRSSPDKSLIFWDDAYIDAIRPFINAFAKRYANDPRIMGVQLGIGDGEYNNNSCDFSDKDGWGEFWMSPSTVASSELNYGFNPEVFEKQSKRIIDIYADAFNRNRGKLSFPNIGPTFSWDDIAEPYNKKLRKIANYVWEKELGNRDGDIEKWMRYVDKAYGVELHSLSDGSCYLDFDEAYAKKMKGRYSGTENEFFGDKDYVIESYGSYENQAYRFMMSSLRALQMRRNYMSISGDSMALINDPLYKTQDFLIYLNKVLGKQIEDTSDAFILLGERYVAPDRLETFLDEPCVKNAKKGAPIRSYGRWLKEKSPSQPALLVSLPESEKYWGQNYTMPYGMDYEYSARESKYFEFDINDELINKRCSKSCTVEVKITYKDTVVTSLNIGYGINKIQRFKTKGDNQIKTVTFNVNSSFPHTIIKNENTDFIVRSDKSLPLIMTRVNFL